MVVGFRSGSDQRHFGLGLDARLRPDKLNDFRLGYLRNHRDTRQLAQSDEDG